MVREGFGYEGTNIHLKVIHEIKRCFDDLSKRSLLDALPIVTSSSLQDKESRLNHDTSVYLYLTDIT